MRAWTIKPEPMPWADAALSGRMLLVNPRQGVDDFLNRARDLSSYLNSLLDRYPETAEDCRDGFAQALQTVTSSCDDHAFADMTDTARHLRRAKQRGALIITLADLGGWWSSLQVGEAMTLLADACLRLAIRACLFQAHQSGRIALPDPAQLEQDCGLAIIAMGKHGARELNYSSDIDIIAFLDPHAVAFPDPDEAVATATRIIRALVKLMQERTADGYVFRTDLRLRPDPGSMPLAVPVETAMVYYEARGQNWERAALIKAAPVAGDRALGEEILDRLKPFIWRRYLDYAAIADVQSVMRQIRSHRDLETLQSAGHNVKLGRGGIREIEFFVQMQQLIAGGRDPSLRGRATVDMLHQLVARGWLKAEVADELVALYQVLRDIEHRLQIVSDEQTHTLPSDDEARARIAALCGHDDLESFDRFAEDIFHRVEHNCRSLFEESQPLSGETGRLVFTGDEPDTETVETLARSGYMHPKRAVETVRNWHFGRVAATSDGSARAALTELVPQLLDAIATTSDPDGVLVAFDQLLSNLRAGTQFIPTLRAQPRLVDLLVTILGVAPRMGQVVVRRPHIFDGLLEPGFFDAAPGADEWTTLLQRLWTAQDDYEDALDRLRVFAAEQRFLLGTRALAGAAGFAGLGGGLADLAETILLFATDRIVHLFEQRHGRVPGGEFGWLALGNLSDQQLTAASDLDLIPVYRYPSDTEQSDGERPLHPSQYYGRLTQRIIAAMSAATAQGTLYEMDLRLRPHGRAGPVATSLAALARYHEAEAWTWEKLALTRARLLGDHHQLFRSDVEHTVRTALHSSNTGASLRADILAMRKELDSGQPPRHAWDIKRQRGGLMDVEFLTQADALLCANGEPLELSDTDRNTLTEAETLYRQFLQLLRLCLDVDTDADAMPPALVQRICRLFDLPDLASAEAALNKMREEVRAIFVAALKA